MRTWGIATWIAEPGRQGRGAFGLRVLISLADSQKRTLSLGLHSLQNVMHCTGDWAGLFAGACTAMIPPSSCVSPCWNA